MKSFLIKITPKKDAKNSITDFSGLDMDLANNERNTYIEIVSLEEISASQIHAGGKNTKHKKPQTTQSTKHDEAQTSGILYLGKFLTNSQ